MFPILRCFRADMDSPYDAFVAYDRRDTAVRSWVTSTLVSTLEDNQNHYGYKLFIMERDSRPGIDNSDAVRAGIQLSKCLILIISEGYASSDVLYFASREGEHFHLQNQHFRVIAVLFNIDTKTVQQIDELLAEYIDQHNYLLPTQWFFWQKLFYLLPHHRRQQRRPEGQPENIALQPLQNFSLTYD